MNKLKSNKDEELSFRDYESETEMNGTLEQIVDFIIDRKIMLDPEVGMELEIQSCINDKNQEVIG